MQMKTFVLLLLVVSASLANGQSPAVAETTAGLVLELRFDRNKFEPGEPITAQVILYNSEQQVVPLHFAEKTMQSPVEFLVNGNGANEPDPSSKDAIIGSVASGRLLELPAGTKKEFLSNLRSQFEFKPGLYSIKAEISCQLGFTRTNVKVFSETVSIEVLGEKNTVGSADSIKSSNIGDKRPDQKTASENTSQNFTLTNSPEMPQTLVSGSYIVGWVPLREKLALGVLVLLGILLLAILWRAARRKRVG